MLKLIPGLRRFSINITDVFILFSALLGLAWLYQTLWFESGRTGYSDTLIVQVMNNKPQYHPLQQQQILKINGARGESRIEIKPGKARFIHSSCRNKFCVLHGWLTAPGDTNACLPNQISITLQSTRSEYDALNY